MYVCMLKGSHTDHVLKNKVACCSSRVMFFSVKWRGRWQDLLFLSCQDFYLGLWCHHSNQCHIHCTGWEKSLHLLCRMALPFPLCNRDSPETVHVRAQSVFRKEAVLELVSVCLCMCVSWKERVDHRVWEGTFCHSSGHIAAHLLATFGLFWGML
jgi:hypothetical protein